MPLKQNILFLFHKKVAWALLIIFFVFDDIVSYWAIKYMHGREGNLLIAPLVEKYPILYFPLIPFTILLMFIITKVILKIAEKLFQKWIKDKELLERIILGTTVIYWLAGNSSANLIFLLGFRIPGIWLKTTLVALPITLSYILYVLFQISRLKNIETPTSLRSGSL